MSSKEFGYRGDEPKNDDNQQMEKYGIVRIPADIFKYREFRYTNLNDAIAQAKRDAQNGQTNNMSK